jgi:hypothetical protein
MFICSCGGSVAHPLLTCLYRRTRDNRILRNQRLSAAVLTGNDAEDTLYFEFATEPLHRCCPLPIAIVPTGRGVTQRNEANVSNVI